MAGNWRLYSKKKKKKPEDVRKGSRGQHRIIFGITLGKSANRIACYKQIDTHLNSMLPLSWDDAQGFSAGTHESNDKFVCLTVFYEQRQKVSNQKFQNASSPLASQRRLACIQQNFWICRPSTSNAGHVNYQQQCICQHS